ncbi:response regulator [Paenibacillus sp. IB182496]|uniref:Response regulator n=1 Tax=Paenibacillus sabuli TaxID=2772509 RepID=A0A927GRW6_9BACL|nr:response regulator [Paenibacillus sabuli]MBD2845686.1 response regulator [Paenibacillus sabuli]
MYRVLIVDDEPEIRMGLRLKVDWEALGLEVAAEASHGEEALRVLEQTEVDILITDMSMPVMDGRLLMDTCRERYPQLRLIVVTGYEDFEYARAAIRNQARDYLLKPVARSELAAVLEKVKRELDEARQAVADRAAEQWKLSQYYVELKEQFILHAVKGAFEREDELLARARLFEMQTWQQERVRFVTAGMLSRPSDPVDEGGQARDKGAVRGGGMADAPVFGSGSAASAKRDDQLQWSAGLCDSAAFASAAAAGQAAANTRAEAEEGATEGVVEGTDAARGLAGANGLASSARTPDKFRLAFELLCRETAAQAGIRALAYRDAGYPGLMHFIVRDGAAQRQLEEALRRHTDEHLGFGLSVGIGEPVLGYGQWKEGYMSALLAWSMHESSAVSGGKLQDQGAALSEETLQVMRRLLQRGELERYNEAVLQELRAAAARSRGHLVKTILQLYLVLDAEATAAHVRPGSGEQLWVRPEMALALDTPDKGARFLAALARRIAEERRAEAGGDEQFQIGEALQYLEDNYMYDLNLPMLAERFNYHPTYFSELFKARTGKTFIQALTEVRMKHARQLLRQTELGLWDIAELTGFSNASYFSAKFKKMFGVSPSEFRGS